MLLECEATHDYKGQYDDELSFSAGDKVEVTADSKLGGNIAISYHLPEFMYNKREWTYIFLCLFYS